jgi:integrase
MSRRKIPGITVWQRGQSWAYRLEGSRDPLTGDRVRPYQGGFKSESEALKEAIEAKKRYDSGIAAHAKRIRVADFLNEWIDVTGPTIKRSSAQGYRDSIRYYIEPIIGQRWLGDLTVPTLNAFYKHLLTEGRLRKENKNLLMYEYWKTRQHMRDGWGPRPGDIAEACGTTYDAARSAAVRYRRGRIPQETLPGLARKTVHNVHVVMRLALADAVRWGYLHANPAEHAVIPRDRTRKNTKQRREATWTVEQLARWLQVALTDRYAGMWFLAATTGMRRSELAGVERGMLDLDNGVLVIEDTRVVVAGRAERSDGKSDAGNRDISLDSFTVEHLRRYLERIDREREAFEGDYPDHDYLMVGPEGRPLHPDTITARFNRLVDRAGVPRIRLHDVRHTYSTLALDNGQNVKLLSERIGHADTSVTLKIYTHRTSGADRAMADQMGSLIQAAVDALKPPVVTHLVTDATAEGAEHGGKDHGEPDHQAC